MAGEPPEKYALRIHTLKVVKAIELNLDVIAQRLIQQDFITTHQASNITGTLGISSFDKASKLMSSVTTKMVYDSRQKWFEKFVYILAEDTTTGDLVKVLVEDFGKTFLTVWSMNTNHVTPESTQLHIMLYIIIICFLNFCLVYNYIIVGKKLGYDGDLLKYIHISVQQGTNIVHLCLFCRGF